MSEGISYITAAECPAVFVNIMRGGPGLGGILPSQADYFQSVKGGGHGDYRLLVLAPASIQEAVEMVMAAFPLAEKYRNPVMILGDGLIGQMMEPVEFPDHLKSAPSNKDEWATNGMETRRSDRRNLIKTLYLVPEELNAHNLKLKAKYERMQQQEVRCETYNLQGDYRILIVSYGTMSRVCRTVIDQFKEKGVEIGMVRPQSLFPFPRQTIQAAVSKASCRAAISVEMSMGQLVEDVELSVKGARPVHWYGKCGGEVPTPEEVIEEISRLL
jgi:2-oxoglutarate ferredoxin oxidoreductase subunit alpha